MRQPYLLPNSIASRYGMTGRRWASDATRSPHPRTLARLGVGNWVGRDGGRKEREDAQPHPARPQMASAAFELHAALSQIKDGAEPPFIQCAAALILQSVPRLVYPPLCPFGTADVVLNEHEACCRMRAVDQ